ncbi:hypothetical protein ALC53_07334, partial [Atta colombica]
YVSRVVEPTSSSLKEFQERNSGWALISSQFTRKKNRKYHERVPFVVYTDLECALEKIDGNPESATYTYHHHSVFSIGYYMHCSYGLIVVFTVIRIQKFGVQSIISANVLTGRYRDSAHSNCNLNYRDSHCISIVFYIEKLEELCLLLRESGEYSDLYLKTDVNNLYGWAMCQLLPYADFNFDFMNVIALNSETGYILKMDVEHPQHFHDAHTDLSFCPTREKPKFINNKFMNNAIFGEIMYAIAHSAETMIAKSNFHSRSVFLENLVAIELRELEMKFDKPIYMGMCILDISKTCLYEFHHEYVPPFREKCKIMYTDTDLIYHIECDNVYDIMKHGISRFDTRDYSSDNAYDIPLANKKIPSLKKGGKSNVVAKSITFEDYTRCLNDVVEMMRRQSCIRSKLHDVRNKNSSKSTQ